MDHKTLRRINDFLSLAVIALAVYIIAIPFVPTIKWWVGHSAPIISRAPVLDLPKEEIPPVNTLVIPRLELRQEIHEGSHVGTLNKGIWHMPDSSSPDKGSNTVLSGHRFTYSGKSVFYYLDKVQNGDNIYVYWDSKLYTYKVHTISEVPPTQVSIEEPTSERRLTIYTCTPLLTAKNRLVIQAELQEVSS